MIDEGYIKYNAHWTKTAPLPKNQLCNINYWRQVMYRHQLIGAYPNGIGFGNISRRWGNGTQFIISGSKTGNYPVLDERHYAKVTDFDIARNEVRCEGPVIASSESMSHAVIYQECPTIHGIIHVHHLALWRYLLFKVPTTANGATYGTPEMATSIIDLIHSTDLKERRIFAMQEHKEGLFVFGETLAVATQVILKYLRKFEVARLSESQFSTF